MALKIRLSRGGAKKKPFYRIVVAEATSPRDGKFVEKIGSYNPMVDHDNKERLVIDAERVKYWISKGAKPTLRVSKLISKDGLVDKPIINEQPKKSAPGKKRLEREAEEAKTEKLLLKKLRLKLLLKKLRLKLLLKKLRLKLLLKKLRLKLLLKKLRLKLLLKKLRLRLLKKLRLKLLLKKLRLKLLLKKLRLKLLLKKLRLKLLLKKLRLKPLLKKKLRLKLLLKD